jgi:hypothetical protein
VPRSQSETSTEMPISLARPNNRVCGGKRLNREEPAILPRSQIPVGSLINGPTSLEGSVGEVYPLVLVASIIPEGYMKDQLNKAPSFPTGSICCIKGLALI